MLTTRCLYILQLLLDSNYLGLLIVYTQVQDNGPKLFAKKSRSVPKSGGGYSKRYIKVRKYDNSNHESIQILKDHVLIHSVY